MSALHKCRSCNKAVLDLVLSLGRTPLANSLVTEEKLNQPESTYPLDLAFCRNCSLVQITETVPPEKLFREYLYFSSFSEAMLFHAKKIAEHMLGSRNLGSHSLVVEIASNEIHHQYLSAAKARKVLHWNPLFTLDQGLQQTINWYREFLGAR